MATRTRRTGLIWQRPVVPRSREDAFAERASVYVDDRAPYANAWCASYRRRNSGLFVFRVRVDRHGADGFGHVQRQCIAVIERDDRCADTDRGTRLQRGEAGDT